MTLDDAAAALDCTEKHVVRLIRQGKLHAAYLVKRGKLRGRWDVNGRDVRARRRRLMQK